VHLILPSPIPHNSTHSHPLISHSFAADEFWALFGERFDVSRQTVHPELGRLGDLVDTKWVKQDYVEMARVEAGARASMSLGSQVTEVCAVARGKTAPKHTSAVQKKKNNSDAIFLHQDLPRLSDMQWDSSAHHCLFSIHPSFISLFYHQRKFVYRIGSRARREVRSLRLLKHIQFVVNGGGAASLSANAEAEYCAHDSDSDDPRAGDLMGVGGGAGKGGANADDDDDDEEVAEMDEDDEQPGISSSSRRRSSASSSSSSSKAAAVSSAAAGSRSSARNRGGR
jgi:hypothetical protein